MAVGSPYICYYLPCLAGYSVWTKHHLVGTNKEKRPATFRVAGLSGRNRGNWVEVGAAGGGSNGEIKEKLLLISVLEAGPML